MKIAWLAPYPVSQLGNAVKWGIHRISAHPCSWIVNLSQALTAVEGTELHILTTSPWVTHTQVVKSGGAFIHIIKCGIPFLHRGWPAKFPLDALTAYRQEVVRLRRVLASIHPDIVHGHGTENTNGLAALASGYPFLISVQGILAEIHKTNPCMYYRLMIPRERRVVQRSRYFSCRTHFDHGFVQRLNPTARIFDIPEAMNPLFWNGQWLLPKSRRILFVGGGAPLKGLHRLIEATALAATATEGVSIDAVGACEPNRQAELVSMANRLGVSIRFHGKQTAVQIAELHRECDVFVLASSNENSPNALAEAMVSGMPCVAFDVGGVGSMLDDGKTGLLVPPGDIGRMAAAIGTVLNDSDLAASLGGSAAEVARIRHRPEHVADLTFAAYREILAAEEGRVVGPTGQ